MHNYYYYCGKDCIHIPLSAEGLRNIAQAKWFKLEILILGSSEIMQNHDR